MYKTFLFIFIAGGILFGFTPEESVGIVETYTSQVKKEIKLPYNFNPEKAETELIQARKSGNTALANKISQYLQKWWKENRVNTLSPLTNGYNPEPGPSLNKENRNSGNQQILWGNDVRIDSRDGVRDVKITSLSNGELYSIATYYDGSNWHIVVHRSTDNGETWSINWDYVFASQYRIESPGILAVNDTLVEWYILIQNDTLYRTWFRVVMPGPTDNLIYFGSPTGGFNDNVIYRNLDFTTDAPVYGTGEFNYITWVEVHYTTSMWTEDSTRVMFARSNELDVSNWEIGPVKVMKTSGDNIYYYKSSIAFGQPYKLWIIGALHPGLYPSIYDETIGGVYSTNFGSTWTPSDPYNPTWITPYDDNLDDYNADIAGSYTDSNWVILVTRTDTGSLKYNNIDIYNVYTTDAGNTWNEAAWVTTDSVNILPDIYVDNASTAFYGVFRKDLDNNGGEEVRLKIGDINNPTSWTYSGSNIINDDNTQNLSNFYSPSVSYNPSTGDAIVAWTNFEGFIYSIWFNAQSRVDVSEKINPSENKIKFLTFSNKNNMKISFTLPYSSNVELNLYSSEGRKIKTLVNSKLNRGNHTYTLKNNLKPGKYFLKLKTDRAQQTGSVILVK